MAGIKISDLPLAPLPIAGSSELEVESATGDSERVAITDLVSGALGLDATFVTVTPNAILPNERILTQGDGINIVDGGAGAAITISIDISPLTLVVTPAPTDEFVTEQGGSILKTTRLQIHELEVGEHLIIPQVDESATPTLQIGNAGLGFYSPASDVLIVAVAGVNRWEYNGNQFRSSQFSGGPALVAANTTANAPTVLPHQGRTSSGLASGAANQIELVADGETGVSYRTLSGEVTVTNSFEDGIVASTTQTQFQGQLNSSYSEVITVANPNDVVTAPQKRRGMQLVIVNRGANVLQVFPANNDDLGNGANNSITVDAGESLIAVGGAGSLGQSWDVLFNGPASGGGNVIKVGVPVDNQVGVWTGDGTIEGTPEFTFDSATQTFGFGAGSTFFTGSSFYFFQDGSLALDGQSTITPTFSIVQSGVNNLSIAISPQAMTFGGGVPIGEFNVSGNLVRWTFDGVPVRIQNVPGTDWIQQSHDGTDYNFAAVNTADINFTGISGRIMQDAETLAFLSEIPTGTVVDSALRWDGAAFIEETQVRISAAGVFTVFDATLADTFSIAHNGSDVLLTSTGAAKIRFSGVAGMDVTNEVGNFEARSGNALMAFDSTNADSIRISHDGVNVIVNCIGTTSLLLQGANLLVRDGGSIQVFDPSDVNSVSLLTDGTTATMGVSSALNFLNVTGGVPWRWLDSTATAGVSVQHDGTDFLIDGLNTTDIIFSGIRSLIGIFAAVQARRTTTVTLTTAFVDVTMDATDVENNAAIVEHDNVNTDDIDIKVDGTYQINYEVTADPDDGTPNRGMSLNGRVRLNDAGTGIAGSIAHTNFFRDASVDGNVLDNHLSCTFFADLTAGDFVTLQLSKTEISGTGVELAAEISFKVNRIL